MPHESSQSAERGPESTAANYLYWQQHGGEWVSEYEARKRNQPLYHIQEFMLVEYMMRNAPARVLEFGCGVGRHLRNLLAIPDIDVHGYDQSPTMVAGCRRWAEQAWIDAHVIVGKSTGPLPYPDRSFDIVYTAEVLVHVRPEDVERLKQPFTRAEAARARADGAAGAGLGLAIVERIARLHGGRFDLLPRDGGGTIARVELPLRAPR